MFLRINQCSIFSACQLPTCKLVSILRVRSLACLILRVLGRLVVVVNLLSSERIYSVISILPSYGVLVDLELSVKADILLRHGERAVVCNGYVVCLPALKGITFLFRAVILYIYRGINLVGLLLLVLGAINIVSYVVSILNPLCIQMQVTGQKILRTNVVLSATNIPTSKSVVFRTFKISEIKILNGILMAARCRYFLGILSHTGDVITHIVGMIGNANRHTSEVTVNMDTVILILNGIPYDFNTLWSERNIRGIKQRLSGGLISIGPLSIGAIIIPVARSEETEIFRYFQIVGVIKAILIAKSVNSVSVGKYPHSLRSYITTVTSRRTQTLYATVTARDTGILVIAARQIVFLALVSVVLRRTALRQKNEVHG